MSLYLQTFRNICGPTLALVHVWYTPEEGAQTPQASPEPATN